MATVRADRPGRLGEVFGGGPLPRKSPGGRQTAGMLAPAGATDTLGGRPGMSVVKTTPMAVPSRARALHASRSLEVLPTLSGSGRDARVGWLEAEVIRVLDRACSLVQPASQVQEFSGADAGSEVASQAPPGLRGQRSGYEEASPLEVEVGSMRKICSLVRVGRPLSSRSF